jgi:hypothetical protein
MILIAAVGKSMNSVARDNAGNYIAAGSFDQYHIWAIYANEHHAVQQYRYAQSTAFIVKLLPIKHDMARAIDIGSLSNYSGSVCADQSGNNRCAWKYLHSRHIPGRMKVGNVTLTSSKNTIEYTFDRLLQKFRRRSVVFAQSAGTADDNNCLPEWAARLPRIILETCMSAAGLFTRF